MSAAAELYGRYFSAGWEPEPRGTVSEWADRYRMLDGRGSAEPGRWRTSRTPYLRAIMDALSDASPYQRIVFMKGAQVGATECGNNWLGYIVHWSPGPTLLVLPTLEMARRSSQTRIKPMIESTPALRERVAEARSRSSSNTTLVKEFPGGHMMMAGANSGAGLRMLPVRRLFLDEIDEYPGDVDDQGDPVSLAEKRTTTFARRKIFMVSTPTIRDLSRIEIAYRATDQRRFFIPCPHCGHMDYLTWSGTDWMGSSEGSHHRIAWDAEDPETAHMVCGSCFERTEETAKPGMLNAGEWRATTTGADARTIGFHLSGLYSPIGWKSWAECVREFVEAKENPFLLKTWVNTVLGESWEERGSSVEPHELLRRVESYGDGVEVPHGVGILVGSVDVQDDRLEVKVKGYGAGEESWLVALTQLHGDPSADPLWFELDRFLKRRFTHASGRTLPIECVAVDSGGHHTEQVYKFAKMRQHRRIFAVKGGGLQGAPVVARPTTHNRYRCKLFVLCVDTAKEVILGRLRVGTRGPGYMHLPATIVDKEYCEQLTAEKAMRKYVKRRGSVKEWVKIRERNEALDLEVYALAALYILGQELVKDLRRRASIWSRPAEPSPDDPQPPAPPLTQLKPRNMRPRNSSWTNRWRS